MHHDTTRNLSVRDLLDTEDDVSERDSGVRVRAGSPEGEDDPLSFRQLGAYRLLEPLGSGAMGRIYRARHVLLDRIVAIKVLRAELADDAAHVDRFVTEARALNRLKHPHVIDVMDIGLADATCSSPWFVMELLEGADVARLMTRQRIEMGRALQIMRQVCEGLDAIHSAGIVHRDIKPENIFITQVDGRDFVKLIDFGVVHLREARTVREPDGHAGVVGTPRYMAPEQVGDRTIDHRADLYAVGAVLFELFAGEPPLDADDLSELLTRVVSARPPRLSSRCWLPPIVRDELDDLIARCLEKDPSKRPASACELIAAIDHIAARLALLSSRHDAAVDSKDAARRSARTPRRASGALNAALGAMVVAALCVGARWGLQEPEGPPGQGHVGARLVVPLETTPQSPFEPVKATVEVPVEESAMLAEARPLPAELPAESEPPQTERIMVTATRLHGDPELDASSALVPAPAPAPQARAHGRAGSRRRAPAAPPVAPRPILVVTPAADSAPGEAANDVPVAQRTTLDPDGVLRPFH